MGLGRHTNVFCVRAGQGLECYATALAEVVEYWTTCTAGKVLAPLLDLALPNT